MYPPEQRLACEMLSVNSCSYKTCFLIFWSSLLVRQFKFLQLTAILPSFSLRVSMLSLSVSSGSFSSWSLIHLQRSNTAVPLNNWPYCNNSGWTSHGVWRMHWVKRRQILLNFQRVKLYFIKVALAKPVDPKFAISLEFLPGRKTKVTEWEHRKEPVWQVIKWWI